MAFGMFAKKIINWYAENGRSLPWRETDNPYYIWLSEVIMQQTRIEQGMDYYERFVREYPTVAALAAASEQQVLKSWQGLGYYSRARNLHAAARHIAYELGGCFPDTYEGIRALKGVGRYTAAAIASFAFRLPYPVIDGNVYRFVSRLYGIYNPVGTDRSYREFEGVLGNLIDRERPDLFNQAMMDFGSLCCKPSGSGCTGCIFAEECVAYGKGVVEQLPVKLSPQRTTVRHFYYFDVRWKEPCDTMLVHLREERDIWQGLYELPLHETAEAVPSQLLPTWAMGLLEERFGKEPSHISIGRCITHRLTHQTINARFILANFDCRPPKIPKSLQMTSPQAINNLPVSRLIDRYLSEM